MQQSDNVAKSFARLRVRVEDADEQHPGDSPPGPAIPLQPAGSVPALERTEWLVQEDTAAKQRSLSANQLPTHDVHKTAEHQPLRKRGLQSHASAGEGGGLMSVVPLDVGRLQAKLINVRLKAAEMANQLLVAQWASPSKGTTHSAPPSQAETTLPSQRPEPLPLVPPARKPTHSGHGFGSMSSSTQHQPHSRPILPDSQPSILDRQRAFSHPTPLHQTPLHQTPLHQTPWHCTRHPHDGLTATSNAAPHHPSPPNAQRKGNSRPVSRSTSRNWSRNSSTTSRRASKNGSEAAGSKRGSREGEQGDVVELGPAPPSPPSQPATEPEVIKSTSKRLVELVQQRQKEGAEAAAAAKAAAAQAQEASLTPADDQGWVQEGNVGRYSCQPGDSTSGLKGRALAERALATIDKAFSLLLKVQEGGQAQVQEKCNKEVYLDGVSDPSDSLQQCAHQLRTLKRDITEKSSFEWDTMEKSSQQPDTAERSSWHQDSTERSSEAGRQSRGSQPLLPLLVSRSPDLQRDPSFGLDTDRSSAPTSHQAKQQALADSWLKRASEPMGQDEHLSLVEAARLRSLTANTNFNHKASQFKQPSGAEVEAGLRRGLRTAKMILRELKDRHQGHGEDGQSSVSSLSEGSNEEEEMTEQEQVYGRGIWGVVGNPAVGRSVAIPKVPPTPDGQRYSGAFGRVGKQRQRLLDEQRALLSRNPAAYEEDHARQSEDKIRKLAAEAHLQLQRSGGPSSDSRTIREFMKSIKLLQSQRPFYLPPIQAKERVQRKPVEASKSMFEERRQMSETREIIDTDRVKQNQFDLDFSRVAAKPLFCKLLTRIDENMRQSLGNFRLDQYIGMLHEKMSAYRDQLRSIFIFYSCVASRFASEEFGRVTLSSWLQFCSDAHIMDNAQKGCTRADLATVFVAVKGGTDSKANEAISDDAMMRFEFYEGIARAAFAKFILPRHLNELSDAVVMAIEACVLPHVPQEALLDPNTFRYDLYAFNDMEKRSQGFIRSRHVSTPHVVAGPVSMPYAVASLLWVDVPSVKPHSTDHWSFLTALYKLFKARDRTRYFRVEHWGNLLEASKLNAHQAGLDKRDAKLIFSWSQLSVLDELKRRKRTVALTQWDFVEAVCRLAEHQALPSEAELDSYFVNEQGMDPKRVVLGLGHTGRFSQSQSNSTSTSPTGAAVAAAMAAAAEGTAQTSATNLPLSAKESSQAEASWSQIAGQGPFNHYPSDFPTSDNGQGRRSISQLPSKDGRGASYSGTNGEQLPTGHTAYCLKLREFQRLVALSGPKRRRPSAGLLSKPSRPLEVKAGLLLHYMLGHMRELYGGQDEADTARKMMHVATMASGGIELA
ncbi:hypothetical protein DUNSADRAFT_11381 [Dunaliella salina]|uniref:Uncharacterized protein n=1 Tax=Dunaliella salina TaxID=3046 RepID=A0ABQ7GDH8_DUNSA|nr:hypothetical protein DUNSADRAFT_11381 [Dunaliella salina]|eukprot:KAF5832674.1 hypothetical protein DUNSADRAFT_11381 [Dunaliella salina]